VFGYTTLAQAPYASLGGNSFTSALSETTTAAENLSALSNFGGLIDEQGSGSASVLNSGNSLLATNAESAIASSTSVALLTAFAALAESAQSTASFTSQADMFASLSEASTASDVIQANSQVLTAIAEQVSAADFPDGSRIFYKAVSEGATASSATSVQVQFVGAITETAAGSSASSVVKTLNVPVTGVQVYVLIGDTLVWAIIDDTQSANWQNITTVQLPGWTDIPS